MSLDYRVLGDAGRDNALWVRIDSGQQIARLLFDCGDRCVDALRVSDLHATDHLFFSHLHMDHVSGFDLYFRLNFCNDLGPNSVWGPPHTSEILQHRFQGYWWNLIGDEQSCWLVTDIAEEEMVTWRFELQELFAERHMHQRQPFDGVVVDDPQYTVRAISLPHHGVSLGYRVDEKPRWNIDTAAVKRLGLAPGPWMQQLKETERTGTISVGERAWELASLREQLLVQAKGDSIAYVTDFLLDDSTFERLTAWLSGCDTLVCEAQYRGEDLELARRNHHATTDLVSRLAAAADVGELILFHLSDRYEQSDWREMLRQAQANFSNTRYPEGWLCQ